MQKKIESDELAKCEKCGELKTRMNFHYNCSGSNKKELPALPHEERQINYLQEKLNEAEWTIHEEREVHEDFMKKSEE